MNSKLKNNVNTHFDRDTTHIEPQIRDFSTPGIEVISCQPVAKLKKYISEYCGFKASQMAKGVIRELPTVNIVITIILSGAIKIKGVGKYSAFATGVHSSAAVIARESAIEGIQIHMNPFGLNALLGIPALEITKQVIDLDDLIAVGANQLVDRLLNTSDWGERFEILNEFFCGNLQVSESSMQLHSAWNLLTGNNPSIKITDVADRVGWSRRHLLDRCKHEFGISPKELALIKRLECAAALIRRQQYSLADIAVTAGYHDQAHMTRDWQRFVDCSPNAWQEETGLPFIQYTHHAGTIN